MISRARYGIEYIKDSAEYLSSDSVKERINKIFDINFDMKDVALSTDILKEWIEYSSKYYGLLEINDYIFNAQDNNGWKLVIDVDERGNVKYCFTDWDIEKTFSPEEYINWDYENWEKYLDGEEILACRDNMQYIEKNAKQMTMNELEEFINYDYSKQIIEMAKKLKIELEPSKINELQEEINQEEVEIDI